MTSDLFLGFDDLFQLVKIHRKTFQIPSCKHTMLQKTLGDQW